MGGIEYHWWKFWRRLRALTEQLPWLVAFAGGFEVPTGGSALRGAFDQFILAVLGIDPCTHTKPLEHPNSTL
jgi:hypothetical protein